MVGNRRQGGRRQPARANLRNGRKSEKPEPAISRVLSRTIIHLGRPSPVVSSNLPGSPLGTGGAARTPRTPLFGLAPGGVYRAADRYRPRGALLPHLFTLTGHQARRFVFCGTFHGLAPSRRYLAPCPKEPGLSSASARDSDCLADSGFSGPRILKHLPPRRCAADENLTIELSIRIMTTQLSLLRGGQPCTQIRRSTKSPG